MAADVCVSTITWVRQEAEEALIRRALGVLAEPGLPVAVADRGSSRTFTEFLAARPQFAVAAPREPSLVSQVQASLRTALQTGCEFILYTESDKELFFRNGMREFIRQAPRGHDVGVVVAARSESSFATFPPFQRYTEATINELCAQFIGERGDYSYGPLLLNRALVPYVDSLGKEVGWGWRHFVFGAARRLGYRVLHIVGEYPCPPDQQDETQADHVHRMRQLSENIQGLILSTSLKIVD